MNFTRICIQKVWVFVLFYRDELQKCQYTIDLNAALLKVKKSDGGVVANQVIRYEI